MRQGHIDMARAISITLVVFGHSSLTHMHPVLNDALSSLRMPLFLMLSGMFFKPALPLGQTARLRAGGLLKPYLVMACALGSLSWMTGRIEDPYSYAMGVMSFNGPLLQGAMYPLWFLPYLWAMHVVGGLLCQTANLSQRSLSWQLGLVGMLFILGHAALPTQFESEMCMSVGTGYLGLPFGADILPLGMAWFLLGHVLAPALRSQAPALPPTLIWSSLFVACQLWGDPRLNLYMREASEPLLSTVAGLSGTLAILGWCQAAARFKVMSSVMSPIGRNSLYVLLWHSPLQNALNHQLHLWWPQWSEATSWLALGMVIVVCHAAGQVVRSHRGLSLWFEPSPTRARATKAATAASPLNAEITS
jgi:polysaccharide biosynthesis protein PslL